MKHIARRPSLRSTSRGQRGVSFLVILALFVGLALLAAAFNKFTSGDGGFSSADMARTAGSAGIVDETAKLRIAAQTMLSKYDKTQITEDTVGTGIYSDDGGKALRASLEPSIYEAGATLSLHVGLVQLAGYGYFDSGSGVTAPSLAAVSGPLKKEACQELAWRTSSWSAGVADPALMPITDFNLTFNALVTGMKTSAPLGVAQTGGSPVATSKSGSSCYKTADGGYAYIAALVR